MAVGMRRGGGTDIVVWWADGALGKTKSAETTAGGRTAEVGFEGGTDRRRRQKVRMTISRASSESAATASVSALRLDVRGSSLRKSSRPFLSIAMAATMLGLRLRVLSSCRQASLRQ